MLIWLYFIWNHSKISAFEGQTRTAAERSRSKAFNMFNGDICVCGWRVYIWSNSHGTVGGHCKRWSDRRWHCFSKKTVLERTNGVKQWHGWRLPLQTKSNQVKGAEWSWIFLCYFSFLRKKSSVYRYR